jgi:hypothetical protein
MSGRADDSFTRGALQAVSGRRNKAEGHKHHAFRKRRDVRRPAGSQAASCNVAVELRARLSNRAGRIATCGASPWPGMWKVTPVLGASTAPCVFSAPIESRENCQTIRFVGQAPSQAARCSGGLLIHRSVGRAVEPAARVGRAERAVWFSQQRLTPQTVPIDDSRTHASNRQAAACPTGKLPLVQQASCRFSNRQAAVCPTGKVLTRSSTSSSVVCYVLVSQEMPPRIPCELQPGQHSSASIQPPRVANHLCLSTSSSVVCYVLV